MRPHVAPAHRPAPDEQRNRSSRASRSSGADQRLDSAQDDGPVREIKLESQPRAPASEPLLAREPPRTRDDVDDRIDHGYRSDQIAHDGDRFGRDSNHSGDGHIGGDQDGHSHHGNPDDASRGDGPRRQVVAEGPAIAASTDALEADPVHAPADDGEHVITHITRQNLADLQGPDRVDVLPGLTRGQSGQPDTRYHEALKPSLAVTRAPNQFDSHGDVRHAPPSTQSTHRPVINDTAAKLLGKLNQLRSVAYPEYGDPYINDSRGTVHGERDARGADEHRDAGRDVGRYRHEDKHRDAGRYRREDEHIDAGRDADSGRRDGSS